MKLPILFGVLCLLGGSLLAADAPAWLRADITITNDGGVHHIAQGSQVQVKGRSGDSALVAYEGELVTIPLESLSAEPVPTPAPTPAPASATSPVAEPTPAGTPLPGEARAPAQSEDVHFVVRGVGEKGIIAERLTLQKIPGSSGTVMAGGFIRSAQSFQPSGKFFVLLGYSKQSEVAEGDTLKVRAYRDGVFKLTDDLDAERTVQAWRAVE
jgi:hypothetical protein